MNYYLGIDLGTSSTKTLLMDEAGTAVGISQCAYDIIKRRPEEAEQDMELLWEAVKSTLADLKNRFSKEMEAVRCISYSGQMHGLVMVDKAGKPIRRGIIWADQRSKNAIREIYQRVGEDTCRSLVLNSLSTGFLISSLMWVREQEPDNYAKIYRLMLPKDYIRYRMCGEYGTDMSDASGSGAFDTANRRWAWELIDGLEIDRSIFPACGESCEIAGRVTEACARETGLRSGIPVAYGGGDTLMQGVGNGIIGPGVLSANIGTACQLSGSVESPLFDPQFRTNTFCHVRPGAWLLMGAHLSGGVALKWLMNQVLEMDSYEAMTALAERVPAGSEGLICLPYLSGERTPWNDPDARGIYLGMTLKHTKAHLIRSTMEGIVFGLGTSAEILRELGVSWDRVIASGGGARGELFLQMQADILDCEIYTNEGQEQACMGAAITAAVARGEYADYKEACGRIVRLRDRTVLPDRENQKRCGEAFAMYRELYARNQDLLHRAAAFK